MGLNALKKRKS